MLRSARAESDLQGRAVIDDRGDVSRHHLGGPAGWRMVILRYRRVHTHQCVEMIDMDRALPVGSGHCWIDLRDHVPRHGQHRRRQVDGHTEADEAAGIGRRDLEQGNIDRQPAGRQESGHLLERNRDVVELTALDEALYIAADEKGPMAVGRARLRRQCRRRNEAHELKVGRAGLHRLQPCEQGAWRSAPGTEINAAARPNLRQSHLKAHELRVVAAAYLTGDFAQLVPYKGDVQLIHRISPWLRRLRPERRSGSASASLPRLCRCTLACAYDWNPMVPVRSSLHPV